MKMKRSFALLLMMLFLTGCQNTLSVSTPSASPSPYSQAYSKAYVEGVLAYLSNSEPTNVPSTPFTMQILDSFKASNEEYSLAYAFKSSVLKMDAYERCFFEIEYVEAPSANGSGTVSIDQKSDSICISFISSSYGNIAPPMIKATITATILALDNTLTIEDARTKTAQLVDTYTGSAYSAIIINNGYSLFMEPHSNGLTFYALNNSYLTESFDANVYQKGSLSAVTAPLNVGELYHFTGVAGGSNFVEVKSDYFAQYVDVVTDATESISMAFQYSEFPFTCIPGEQYDFYGMVNFHTKGKPVLWVKYCRKVE